MTKLCLYRNKGFSILAVLIAIAAIIIAVGIWTLSGNANNITAQNRNSTSDVLASNIINNGISFKSAFDKMMISGISSSNVINYRDYPYSGNLSDPNNGVSVRLENYKALNSDLTNYKGYWLYFRNAKTPLGTLGGYEKLVVLTSIKNSVCRSINYSLHGSENIPNLYQPAYMFLYSNGATFSIAESSSTIVFPNSMQDWTSGCLGDPTAPDDNLFFMVLEIR